MRCKNCQAEIPSGQINIATDLAHCKVCNTIFKISETGVVDSNRTFDIKDTPNGTWFRRISNNEIIIGASTRSPMAFFLVPFMLIWSGGSLGGIYGTQIASGDFDPMISLFGIPFLIGTVIFGSITVMMVAGKVEIRINKQGGRIFTGVGKIGYSKGFLWNEVSNLNELSSAGFGQRGRGGKISLEGKRRITFGMFLRESRRYYMLEALKKIHFGIQKNNSLSF